MNFRELTALEARNATLSMEDYGRPLHERVIIADLPYAVADFFAKGGKVEVLPPMKLSHTDSYVEMNRAQKARIAERNAKASARKRELEQCGF